MLAALSGAPVVPVYVSGTGQALPRGATWPRPARIRVAYGEPLRFDRGRGRERYQAISDEIMAAIGRLMAEGGQTHTNGGR
jgi:1-acyl-sn-glycerol-3-phosphate acyltransferase